MSATNNKTTKSKAQKTVVDIKSKLIRSKEFKTFVRSVIGYGYTIVHKSAKGEVHYYPIENEQQVENIKGITVLEDSTVEKGGCVVETDFGSIDARISSQLTELENKILEISPLKTIKRAAPTVEE